MNNFQFKTLENSLKKHGLLRLHRINSSILTDYYPYAAFIEHRGAVFSFWTSINVNIAVADLIDFDYSYNSLVSSVEYFKERIDSLFFDNVYDHNNLYNLSSSISKFIYMQIFNISELRRSANMTFGLYPAIKEDILNYSNTFLKDGNNTIDTYDKIINKFHIANLEDVRPFLYSN